MNKITEPKNREKINLLIAKIYSNNPKIFKHFKKLKTIIRLTLQNIFNTCYDSISIIFNIQTIQTISKRYKNQNTIGFIADKFLPRIEKLATGLSSKGYNIILFTKDESNFSKVYAQIITYKSSWKALILARYFKPVVYHVFSSFNFNTAFILIKNKKGLPPIIFDDYDVIAGMVYDEFAETIYPGQIKKEKFCLENSDGLCCRSLETQYAKRYLNYKYKGKRIFYPEYLWNQPIIEKNSNSNNNKTLLYVGNFHQYTINTIAPIKKIGWQVHFYPAHSVKTKSLHFPENVKLHKSINPKDLIETISKYSVAIQFPSYVINQNKKTYSIHKNYYSASGKVFDYIEANLKVLISDEIHQKWLLNRYGHAIELDEKEPIEDVLKKLSNFDNNNFDKVGININNLDLFHQTPRLIEFYTKISQQK